MCAFWMASPKEENASGPISSSPAASALITGGVPAKRVRLGDVGLAVMLENVFLLQHQRRGGGRHDDPADADFDRRGLCQGARAAGRQQQRRGSPAYVKLAAIDATVSRRFLRLLHVFRRWLGVRPYHL